MIDSRSTLAIDGTTGTVLDYTGKVQTVMDLNWLSNMLVNGTPLTRNERRVAGMAIKNLLAQQKQPQGEMK